MQAAETFVRDQTERPVFAWSPQKAERTFTEVVLHASRSVRPGLPHSPLPSIEMPTCTERQRPLPSTLNRLWLSGHNVSPACSWLIVDWPLWTARKRIADIDVAGRTRIHLTVCSKSHANEHSIGTYLSILFCKRVMKQTYPDHII